MGDRNTDHLVKESGRQTFVLSAVSGDYASERLTFGVVGAGEMEQSFLGITALLESGPAGTTAPSGAVVELWLPRVRGGDEVASARTDADYHFSGQILVASRTSPSAVGVTVAYGSATWPLAGYPGGQIRVKSGGNAGSVPISGTAF